MASIFIEAKATRKQANASWSKWKPASAALAALSIGCSDPPLGTFDDNCYTSNTASGPACLCNTDGGVNTGMFDDAGSCLPAPQPTGSLPSCPADPNPGCAQQTITKTLTLDGGASSSLTIGDYTITLQGTSQSGTAYGASISLNDFCGNLLDASSLTIGVPVTYTEAFGNISITATLTQVATADPQWAVIAATMSCPFYVQTDGGMAPPVCGGATSASKGGDIYTGSVVQIGGYGFAYTGDLGGYANFLVSCGGATLDSLQCIVGAQTVVSRPMDNGGRTIFITPHDAFVQYTNVDIQIQ